MPALQRNNVQSLILAPYMRPISRHFLFTVGTSTGGRRFLAEWLPSITCGEQDPTRRDSLVNLSLSWTGLLALGAFDTMGGKAAAADAFYVFPDPPDPESLRVAGRSAPANWWNGRFVGADIHLVIHVYASTEAELHNLTARLRESAQRCDVAELLASHDNEPITGRLIDGRQLHFGYQDGISHPSVNWDDEPARPDLIPRGDVLLGYPNGNYSTYPDKPPFSDFVRDGALAAFMLIYQDVAAFNRFLRTNAPQVAPALAQKDAEEYLAAKLMGRWRDGTPMALSPERADPALALSDDFGYGDDLAGNKCPVTAHIRLANARDQPLNALNKDLFPGGFPRVLRRGSPYGPPLESEDDDGIDRGIVGMFLCANLNKQFYTITRWLGRTDFSPVLRDPVAQDPIVGNTAFPGASPSFAIPQTSGGSTSLKRVEDFVRIQGVAFLFLPSMATLRSLAVV